jgi:hypothetical protein
MQAGAESCSWDNALAMVVVFVDGDLGRNSSCSGVSHLSASLNENTMCSSGLILNMVFLHY